MTPRHLAVIGLITLAFIAAPAQAQTTRYVDGVNGNDQAGSNDCESQAFPCRTLSHAIETSFGGDILRIANAIYTESLNIDRPLTLRGESETGTIIQAHAQPGRATSRVINIDGDLEVAISDLTIRHGVALEGQSLADRSGGGIFISDAALTMSHVTVSGNAARGDGGGIFNLDGSLTLTNVSFRENRVARIGGEGGGLHNTRTRGSAILTNVIFSGNSVGGRGGGISNDTASLTLTNVIFSGNSADGTGGGIYNIGASITLTNVSISGNSADEGGGGISNYYGSHSILRNTILWGNTAGNAGNEIYNNFNSSAELHYSLHGADPDDIVQGGGFTATHSLISDPLFVDAGNGDLRLAAGSPAIDMGAPATDPSLFPGGPDHPVDLDGNPRFSHAAIDIGAYEFTNTLFQDRFEQ